MALKRIYNRGPILGQDLTGPLTFLQFRRSLQGTFACDGAVVVYCGGMWLIIETDGYVHS